jgi:hypothetical protein
MDKINFVIESDQTLSNEQQTDRPHESPETITPIAPECFSLIGGGSGIILL